MSFIFGGGGGGGGGGSSSGTQQNIQREAPGVESRKLALYDQAAKLAAQPVSLPAIQVAPATGLEQAAFTQAGQTGVGAPALQAGITAAASGVQAPNINQFFNPYQSFVIDEINRQAAQAQNTLAARAIQSGAFGGGREGVAQAELERARLGQVGLAQQRAFDTALGAAQQQQQQQAQIGGLLADIGGAQQRMAQGDINTLVAAGGIQRQLAQNVLDAQRQSQLQQAFEPFQRAEFLSNLYAAGPKSQSTITASTQPQTSPLAQSIGTGIGAFQAFQGLQGGR